MIESYSIKTYGNGIVKTFKRTYADESQRQMAIEKRKKEKDPQYEKGNKAENRLKQRVNGKNYEYFGTISTSIESLRQDPLLLLKFGRDYIKTVTPENEFFITIEPYSNKDNGFHLHFFSMIPVPLEKWKRKYGSYEFSKQSIVINEYGYNPKMFEDPTFIDKVVEEITFSSDCVDYEKNPHGLYCKPLKSQEKAMDYISKKTQLVKKMITEIYPDKKKPHIYYSNSRLKKAKFENTRHDTDSGLTTNSTNTDKTEDDLLFYNKSIYFINSSYSQKNTLSFSRIYQDYDQYYFDYDTSDIVLKNGENLEDYYSLRTEKFIEISKETVFSLLDYIFIKLKDCKNELERIEETENYKSTEKITFFIQSIEKVLEKTFLYFSSTSDYFKQGTNINKEFSEFRHQISDSFSISYWKYWDREYYPDFEKMNLSFIENELENKIETLKSKINVYINLENIIDFNDFDQKKLKKGVKGWTSPVIYNKKNKSLKKNRIFKSKRCSFIFKNKDFYRFNNKIMYRSIDLYNYKPVFNTFFKDWLLKYVSYIQNIPKTQI